MNNYGKYWSKEEELMLMDELSDKKTINEISKLHGRSIKAIEMRIEIMIRKQYEAKYTISSLMNLYNKSENEIMKIIESTQESDKMNFNLKREIEEMKSKINNIEKYVNKIYKLVNKKTSL